MKLNELLKSFKLKSAFLIFFIIINYSGLVISAEKRAGVHKTDYVVHIYFRNYRDKKNGKYDEESEFNLSGFNDNARWDSIFMLTQFIEKQNPKIWWFNDKDNPLSIVIKFSGKDKAQSCYKELKKREYGSIIRDLKLEKFIYHYELKSRALKK